MRIFSAILLLALAGCSAYGSGPIQTPEAQALNAGGLDARDLTLWPGQCALIFRHRGHDAATDRPVIFAQTETRAIMVLEGKRLELRRAEASALRVENVPKDQTFTSTGLKAQLLLKDHTSDNGASIRGVLSLTKSNGWSTVIPLAGGRRCRQ